MNLDLTKSKFFMDMNEAEYHAFPAWSYSIIARYARGGFKSLETLFDKVEPSSEMKFGSLFDSMMTKGMDVTNKEYVVFHGSVPTESIKNIMDTILEESGGTPWEDVSSDMKIEVMDRLEYQRRWKPETRIDSLNKYVDYYDFIYESYGKEIVSEDDWNDAVQMRDSMLSNEYVKSLFGEPGRHGDMEYLYQVQFTMPVHIGTNLLPVKCMFDLIVIDHKKKTITPVDLKTSHMPAYEFAEHWLKMRYDLQAGLYNNILEEVVDNLTEIEDLDDYRILPYLFVDISRTDMVPVVFEFNPVMNRNVIVNNCRYKNWMELLKEIKDYQNTNAKVPSYIKENSSNNLMRLLNHE